MKWVEMIRLRSTSSGLLAGLPTILEQVKQINDVSGAKDAMVLKHALYDGDLAVVLVWENGRDPVRTREGLLLAEGLGRYGMVDHGVWCAAPGFEEQMEKTHEACAAERVAR